MNMEINIFSAETFVWKLTVSLQGASTEQKKY